MAKAIYLGDPSTGVARKVKKLYVGDANTGVARKIKKVYVGDANTGVARLCYTAGERGYYLASYSKGTIWYSKAAYGAWTQLQLANTLSHAIIEFGDYYVVGWSSGSSRGLYYSTDCKEWKSSDVTATGANLNYYMSVKKDKLYLYKNESVAIETSDCVTFKEVQTSTLPWWGTTEMHDGTLVKTTRTPNGNYHHIYRIMMSKDNGVTWTTSNYSRLLQTSSSYYHSSVTIENVNGRCLVMFDYASYYSSSGDFQCDYDVESLWFDLSGATPEPVALTYLLQKGSGSNAKSYYWMRVWSNKLLTYEWTKLLANYGMSDPGNTQIAKVDPAKSGFTSTGTIYRNTNDNYANADTVKAVNNMSAVYCKDEDCFYVIVSDYYNSNTYNTLRERGYKITKTDAYNYSTLSNALYEETTFPQSLGYRQNTIYKAK